jgi:hypothetical protein
MQHDLDRSLERLNRAEEYKRSALGYGLTKQGQALRREYQDELCERIGVARATKRRDKALWRALKGIDDETLALRLLTAGISVCGLDDLLAEAVKTNALLSPLLEPPRPWTQVSKGALPPDHWAKVSLIRGHQASQAAARKAISDGRMRKVLDAINALQAVPFTINRPILDFVRRAGAENGLLDIDIVTADCGGWRAYSNGGGRR